jgi:hypothetical protein
MTNMSLDKEGIDQLALLNLIGRANLAVTKYWNFFEGRDLSLKRGLPFRGGGDILL